ncbi:aquaporin-like protein [Russula ochroleuca]|uniref:Aquaporin-like protein n=1 Tax=Russula ochroleuca TaxID=152965 RepID=A0A9P5TDH0_9AGAM|nr:aquaporin-like protein [Russula ochroleuca]
MAGASPSHVHPIQHNHILADIQPRPAIFRSWERARRQRVHWLVECIAEMFGVFCYCYAGLGATAAFIVGNILKLNGIGSLFTIGVAYGLGIVVALVVCTATSGGHLSPAVTLVHVLFNGLPPTKAVRYITAQIFGSFMASIFVYWQWNILIKDAEAALRTAGVYDTVNFTSLGPAGIFALYANPAAPLALVFLNEFVSDFFIGIVIAACLDPTNFFTPPVATPWVVGLTYGTAIWGFSSNGLAANTARDVGGRLVAIAVWGTKANGGKYAAIAALTNILATVAAYAFYEFIFKDSSRVLTVIGKEYHDSRTAQLEHRRYHLDNLTVRYGAGSDSERGKHVENLEK